MTARILAFLFVCMAGSAAQAQTYHYVDGLDPNGYNWLALRMGPGFDAPWSPTKMGPGTLLSVLDRSREWLLVRVQSSGETGWANSRYIFCCRTLR